MKSASLAEIGYTVPSQKTTTKGWPMQCTTEWKRWYRGVGEIAHTVAVLGLILMTVMGRPVEGIAGWVARPPRVIELGGRRKERNKHCGKITWGAGWAWMRGSWKVVAIRSGTLLILSHLTERQRWAWVWLLPWGLWVWRGLGVAWPELREQALYRALGRVWEEASRWALVGLGMTWLVKQASAWRHSMGVLSMGMSLGVVGDRKPSVEVEGDEGAGITCG
jgi:hypothetical protein